MQAHVHGRSTCSPPHAEAPRALQQPHHAAPPPSLPRAPPPRFLASHADSILGSAAHRSIEDLGLAGAASAKQLVCVDPNMFTLLALEQMQKAGVSGAAVIDPASGQMLANLSLSDMRWGCAAVLLFFVPRLGRWGASWASSCSVGGAGELAEASPWAWRQPPRSAATHALATAPPAPPWPGALQCGH